MQFLLRIKNIRNILITVVILWQMGAGYEEDYKALKLNISGMLRVSGRKINSLSDGFNRKILGYKDTFKGLGLELSGQGNYINFALGYTYFFLKGKYAAKKFVSLHNPYLAVDWMWLNSPRKNIRFGFSALIGSRFVYSLARAKLLNNNFISSSLLGVKVAIGRSSGLNIRTGFDFFSQTFKLQLGLHYSLQENYIKDYNRNNRESEPSSVQAGGEKIIINAAAGSIKLKKYVNAAADLLKYMLQQKGPYHVEHMLKWDRSRNIDGERIVLLTLTEENNGYKLELASTDLKTYQNSSRNTYHVKDLQKIFSVTAECAALVTRLMQK